MPASSDIYGQIQPVRPVNRLADLAQAMQVQGLQQHNQLASLKMDEYQRGVEDQNALRSALSAPGADPYNALLKLGRVKEANDFAKGQADAEKTKKEGAKIDFDMGIKRAEHAASVLSLAKDQGSYDQVRQVLANQFGPDSVAQMPAQFDPAYIQAEVAKGLTRAQQLADQRAKEGQAITMRGQDMTAETARRGQDITVRGQDLANDRAREANASGKVPAGYRLTADGKGLEFIPGGPADPNSARRAAPTEDERKAAGWLAQATNAFSNMEKAIKDDPEANKPGVIESMRMVPEGMKNMTRSDARQRFNQGASSFAEAALRAATGAGVNESEARQKIAELTPQWGDTEGNIKQKRAGLKVYLDSLAVRSGRANPGASGVPAPGATADNDPLGLRNGG